MKGPGRYLFLTVVCLLLFFAGLGSSSLWDIDETSNARAAEEMKMSGDWVVPTLNGELRTDKPPLHYWFMMAAYRVFGVREFSARFFAAVFGLLTVLLLAWAGGKVLGEEAGTMAGLILAVSFLFTVSSRSATTDAFLVFFTNLAVLAGYFSLRSRLMGIVAWLAMGLAVLAKGPVGLALPMGALVLFCLLDRRGLSGLLRLFNPLGLLVFTAVAAPWYVMAASRTGGGLIEGFILKHNVGRFLGAMESHRGPFFYYLLILLPGFFPWSTFLPQSIAHGLRMPRASGKNPGFGKLLVIWSTLVVVFFSASRTKLPTYILPAFPALALLTAAWCCSEDRPSTGSLRGQRWSWWLAFLPALFLPALLVVVLVLRVPDLASRPLVTLPFVAAPVLGLVAVRRRIAPARGFRWAAYAAGLAVLALHLLVVPALESYRMAPRLGRAIAARARQGDAVGKVSYFRPALLFYGKLPVRSLRGAEQVAAFLDLPEGRFVVAEAEDFQALPEEVRTRLRILEEGLDAADLNRTVLAAERIESSVQSPGSEGEGK